MMRLRPHTSAIFFLSLVCLIGHLDAELRLPKVISSHMVLQRDSNAKIWGWAKPGESIRVRCSWLDAAATCKADGNGRWELDLKTTKAGGPYDISIEGATEKIQLKDVLLGEVWIASGQSNMEMPLVKVSGAYTGIRDSKKEVSSANYPKIRLFQAGNFSSKEPLDDVKPGIEMYGIPPAACRWQPCSPKSIPNFASTAYFFARELHSQLNIPIGIIDASWGGTPAEAWTPQAGLQKLNYASELQQAKSKPQNPSGKIPTRLYNGMIHPLRKMTIRGAVWYQGEGNSRRAAKYRELFSTMISEWRSAFSNEFPFYFVQISPYNYRGLNSAFLREAQLQTLSLPKTGMAVTMDIGNLTDIHPKNKQEVGRRLALWALHHDYGKNDLAYSGPIYKSLKVSGGEAILNFNHAEGLTTSDGKAPSHFEIAGADKVFHKAIAKIDGQQVIVQSDKVMKPVAVRYAFSNDAQPNLTNGAKLPASSFRTDQW